MISMILVCTVTYAVSNAQDPLPFNNPLPTGLIRGYASGTDCYRFLYPDKQIVYVYIDHDTENRSDSIHHVTNIDEISRLLYDDLNTVNTRNKLDIDNNPFDDRRETWFIKKGTATILLYNIHKKDLTRFRNYAAGLTQLPSQGLKDYYKDLFPIGVAVSPRSIAGPDSTLIIREFNSLTPENAMKMGPIHPEEHRYDWKDADAIVDFAIRHGMKIRGHNLCWHEQTPAWLFKDATGKQPTKDILLQRLKAHITAVVSRYKGKVYAWDVVNEAIDDDSTRFLRNSPWLQICGDEFIIKAFEWAHQADPDAQLFYNDYNTERPEKRERVYRLLKQLVDAGVPITGVGLQGHWSIYEPSEKELKDAILRFSSLGLKVQITELDISIYPWEKFKRDRRPGETDAFTPELEQRQITQYENVFSVFRKTPITGVTFWNVTDKHTWLDNYPVPGRKNYPLLFDTAGHPKKAYWKVTQFQ